MGGPPVVVTRKAGGGNRTARSVETQHTLASVFRTIDQRDLDPTEVLTLLLYARCRFVGQHSCCRWPCQSR